MGWLVLTFQLVFAQPVTLVDGTQAAEFDLDDHDPAELKATTGMV